MKKINVILAALTLFGLMTGCGGSSNSGSNTTTSENATDETQTVADANVPAEITMTVTPKGEVQIMLDGSQTATIDWGDGSPVETVTLGSTPWHEHHYAKKTEYTMHITGENITDLGCPSHIKTLQLNVPTLKELLCVTNELTTLDLSPTPALKRLNCYNNFLKTLNVSQNSALEELNCYGNKLTALDVSKNPSLTSLECGSNQLTSLDVSQNNKLSMLDCSDNKLSTEALNALFRTLCTNNNDKSIYIGSNPGTDACDRTIAEKKGWIVEEYMEGDPPSRDDEF